MLAGIDAIEVHGDRLLGSLCSEVLNHRSDAYGGSFENRIRYALEVVKAIKEAAPDLTIEYKLPIITLNKDGSLRGKGGLKEAEGIAFAKKLEEAGVDMIQVAQANHTGNMEIRFHQWEMCHIIGHYQLLEKLKKLFLFQ